MRQDRYSKAKAKYDKASRRRSIGYSMIVAGAVAVAILFLVPFPSDLRGTFGLALGLGGFVVAYAGLFVQGTHRNMLPEKREDRMLYLLKPALNDLETFKDSSKDSDKKEALKKLRKVADSIDEWDVGNLKVVEESAVGKAVKEFEKNFRGRILPAVEKGEPANIEGILQQLAIIENLLETGQLREPNLTGLNDWMTAHDRELPYIPSPHKLRTWMKTRKIQIGLGALLLIAPILTGAFLFYEIHTTSGEASLGGIGIFSGLAALVAVFARPQGT